MSAGQPGRGAPNWDAIPPELAQRPQWLLWRFEVKRGQSKPLKVPYWTTGVRRSGVQGSDGDRAKLVTLEQARLAYDQGGYSGVGFAFLPGDGLIGIDIDGAIDLETGEVSQRLQAIIEAVASYTEYSPSGRGAHIIAAGETTTNKCNEIGLEIFAGRQYFTFTGNHWSGTPQTVQPIGEEALRRLNITVTAAKARRKLAPGVLAAQPGASDLRTRVESALESLSPDMGYNDWIAIGWALREAFGEFGFGLWSDWSARGDKYQGDGDLQSHWKSFTCSRAPDDAVGVIFARARDAGWKAPSRATAGNTSDQAVTSADLERMDADIARFDGLTSAAASPTTAPPEWPAPSMPGALSTPDVPADLLPGVWGQMAQAVSESTQTPAVMSVLCALGVLGALLQNRYIVDTGGHREVLAFWTISVSASGTRKSSVMGAFTEPALDWEKVLADRMRRQIARNEAVRSTTLKRIEALKQQAGKADEGELKRLRDDIEALELSMPDEIRPPLLFTEDVTPETLQRLLAENGGRMSILSDEPGIFRILGGLYGGGGGASLEVFLKSYTGSALKVARASRTVFVVCPCLSMALMIQPDLLAELAGSNQFRGSGLMARLWYGVPESNVGRRDVRQRRRVSPELRDAYGAAVFALMEGYPAEDADARRPRVLTLSAAAEELWLDFSQEVEDQLIEGGALDAVRDWGSKLPGAVARVAALLELAATGLRAEEVSHAAMDRAIRLARLMVPHTRAAFGLLGADVVEADANDLLSWVRANRLEEFTTRDAMLAKPSRFKTAAKLTKAVDKLKQLDCVRSYQRKNEGARPSTVIQVNPACLS
jgi:replicative DNA helicase